MLKPNIIMISSSSKAGGGPSHIFLLKKLIQKDFNIFYAMPKSKNLKKYINKNNYVEISERKISLIDIFKLIIFLRNNSINIIHAHGKGASVIGRILKLLTGKNLIYTFHGVHTDCLNLRQKLIYIWYEKLFGWIDDHKIFVSKSEMQQALELNFKILDRFSIINNSVINMPFKKKTNLKLENPKLGIKNSNPNIVSICRLVDQKNVFEIFKIAKKMPNYNFLVIGDGELYVKAKNYLIKFNITNVYMFGNKRNVFKYLNISEIFLSTSLYEGHPISILEAMSIGLPILASKVVGNVNTIDDGISGFYYHIGNIQMACKFLKQVLNNDNLKYKMSKASFFKQRKSFSIKKMRNSYLTLYKKYI
tara:strand:- start:4 stop:1092 length:1089 start_codon:yes stop_codon:yes gene_type:complete